MAADDHSKRSTAGWVFLHGPRDGELLDELTVLDVAPGPLGGYGASGKVVVDTALKTVRYVLQWTPAEGGRRRPPRCDVPCCAGCPAAGLAGA